MQLNTQWTNYLIKVSLVKKQSCINKKKNNASIPQIYLNQQGFDPMSTFIRWKVWCGVNEVSLATVTVVHLGWGLAGEWVDGVHHTQVWGQVRVKTVLKIHTDGLQNKVFLTGLQYLSELLQQRSWQTVRCFCPGRWTLDVHNSWKFDKELKAFPYLDIKQVTERQRGAEPDGRQRG